MITTHQLRRAAFLIHFFPQFPREHGSVQVKSRWAYAKRLKTELGRKIAGAVAGYAEENHSDVIVFEYLETKGKISGRKKQKLHLWRKRDIQIICSFTGAFVSGTSSV